MTDNIRQLMHEKLDGVLSEDLTEELYQHLAHDEEAAQEYARLETLDRLLSSAPQARAPQRLAVTIMARLAQAIETQANLQDAPEEVRQAVMVSLSLSMIAMMPLMVAASWLVMNAMAKPELLTRVLERVVFLMRLMNNAQLTLLDEVERIAETDPHLAAAAMRLLPAMTVGLLDAMEMKGDAQG
jgi:anti-sigma factor RsiW